MHLDPHERPPEYLRTLFKQYRNADVQCVQHDECISDPLRDQPAAGASNAAPNISEAVDKAFHDFLEDGKSPANDPQVYTHATSRTDSPELFAVADVPGLLVYPGMLPSNMQRRLLDVLLHRDLSCPEHLTNVHLHHKIEHPGDEGSFFDHAPSLSTAIQPKDPGTHKPMTIFQFLGRKLRWMTLGGQYDWTNKIYPEEKPPQFPPDISQLLRSLFPQTVPEAAILNLYTPGDTLSMHRDVSEDSDRPLISISIGCDALFVIGLAPQNDGEAGKHAILRLRSGDAVYMTGESRYAWHGVPSVIAGTCPADLDDWPCLPESSDAGPDRYEQWRGWLSSKRINLNVRQMRDNATDHTRSH